MSNFNFKNLFSETVIHNEEYFSNKCFLIKKSLLKKSQLEFINSFPLDTQLIKSLSKMIENESRKSTIAEFIPQFIVENNEYNTLIMEIDRGYKDRTDWLNKIYPAIKEEYYNFILSLNCKIFSVNDNQISPLSIYNNQNEFVGIVLPVRVKDCDIPETQNYGEYLNKLLLEQEAKKLSKQNSKKCLYISNNKAIVRNKELTCIADIINDKAYKNLYIEKSDKQDAEVYIDLGIVCVYVNSMMQNISHEDIKYHLGNLTNYTLEMALEYIYNRKNTNQLINVADIKLIELSGASKEDVQELIDYRQEWYDRKAKDDQEKKLKLELEDKEYTDSKNKIAEELVLAAEQAILNRQDVKNKEVTIYKSRYESNDTSLILHIMKLYDIKVPIKTQGWINQALTSIQYNEEWSDYSYRYLKSSANSNVFNKYLNMLIKGIRDKYEVVAVAK